MLELEASERKLNVARKFLSVQELAKILSVSKSFVYSMLEKDKIKGKKMGRRWLIPLAEVERLTA